MRWTPVPCATCGAPSTGIFRDGSPSWGTDHSHVLPRPYYSDASVAIYHGDYREISPGLLVGMGADVLVLDPPFDLWPEVDRRGLVAARTVVAFTTWQWRDPVTALFGRPRAELIWAFADGRWTSHELPRTTHETILVYGPTGSAYVGPLTDGVPVRKGTGSIGRDRLGNRTYTPHDRKILDSVLSFPRDVGAALGVWSKPLGLLSRLLEWTAPEDGLVVDPFAGSGTTLVAAKALGLRAVGIEIEERSCETAANRCRQDTLGLS